MFKILMTTILALLVLALPVVAGELTMVDGVTHVKNSVEPRNGVETMELEELWRHGGDDDDEVFFGVVLKALTDDDGNIYVLDQQLSQVHVFGPAGDLKGTLSREGDGPGEVRRPSDMLWMPDGTLGIVQTFPGRIVQVDLADTPAGIFKTGDEGAIIAVAEARSRGGNLVMGVIDIEAGGNSQDRHLFLGSYDEQGKELARYIGFDVHWDFPGVVFREREQYFVMFNKWDLTPEGRVIAPPNFYEYAFGIYNPDGTLERMVSREFEPYKRDDQDRMLIGSIMEGAASQFPFPIETEIEDYETPIASLVVHPDGDVWVLSARGARNQPEGVFSTWDVFDSEGHLDRRVQIECPGDARRDGMYFVGDDRLLVVHGLIDALTAQFGGSAEEGGPEASPVEIVLYEIDD